MFLSGLGVTRQMAMRAAGSSSIHIGGAPSPISSRLLTQGVLLSAPSIQSRPVSFSQIGEKLDVVKSQVSGKAVEYGCQLGSLASKFKIDFGKKHDRNFKEQSQLLQKYIDEGKITLDIIGEAKLQKLQKLEIDNEKYYMKHHQQKAKAKIMFFSFMAYSLYFCLKSHYGTDFDMLMFVTTGGGSILYGMSACNQVDNQTEASKQIDAKFIEICKGECKCDTNCKTKL
ncbi:hypothetical protein QKU48_gp1397 [Fadolivirus algeromassiliense]|jgi:hypothetical protein|uniref:Uncharacterized protein n=1 Tax=Fadolivirus FV1/VV64 TaxID=3070911 RepID=A0A7D3V647_9VIRU|nr:hypothetical protein QKU48_gp1397 [Fadolivirus algeromassiliense]QKF94855.1 hypothetical protein Fadolivirus_1_1397 [Fadolivirus FV1/VV64]